MPAVALTTLALVIMGVLRAERKKTIAFFGAMVCLMSLSIVRHKEHRLLATPHNFLLVYAGHGIIGIRRSNWLVYFVVISVFTQCTAWWYLSRWHQVGKEQIAIDAGDLARKHGSVRDVAFLTPCCATPTRVVLHLSSVSIFSMAPNCGPGGNGDEIMHDPLKFVKRRYGSILARAVGLVDRLPDAVVVLTPEEEALRKWLARQGYQLWSRRFNAHFPVDRYEPHASLFVRHPPHLLSAASSK